MAPMPRKPRAKPMTLARKPRAKPMKLGPESTANKTRFALIPVKTNTSISHNINHTDNHDNHDYHDNHDNPDPRTAPPMQNPIPKPRPVKKPRRGDCLPDYTIPGGVPTSCWPVLAYAMRRYIVHLTPASSDIPTITVAQSDFQAQLLTNALARAGPNHSVTLPPLPVAHEPHTTPYYAYADLVFVGDMLRQDDSKLKVLMVANYPLALLANVMGMQKFSALKYDPNSQALLFKEPSVSFHAMRTIAVWIWACFNHLQPPALQIYAHDFDQLFAYFHTFHYLGMWSYADRIWPVLKAHMQMAPLTAKQFSRVWDHLPPWHYCVSAMLVELARFGYNSSNPYLLPIVNYYERRDRDDVLDAIEDCVAWFSREMTVRSLIHPQGKLPVLDARDYIAYRKRVSHVKEEDEMDG